MSWVGGKAKSGTGGSFIPHGGGMGGNGGTVMYGLKAPGRGPDGSLAGCGCSGGGGGWWGGGGIRPATDGKNA